MLLVCRLSTLHKEPERSRQWFGEFYFNPTPSPQPPVSSGSGNEHIFELKWLETMPRKDGEIFVDHGFSVSDI